MARHVRLDRALNAGHALRYRVHWRVTISTIGLAALLWGGVAITSLLGPEASAISLTSELVKIGVNMTIAPCTCSQPVDFTYLLYGTIAGRSLAHNGVAIGSAVAYQGSADLAYFEYTELMEIGAPVHLILSTRDSSKILARIDGVLPNCYCTTLTLLLNATTPPGQPNTLPPEGRITISGQNTPNIVLQTAGAVLKLPPTLPRTPAALNQTARSLIALLPPVLLVTALLATVIAASNISFELWSLYAWAASPLRLTPPESEC
jgi:hypothetical protein